MPIIYENGQVVIPKHLRESLNLTPGTHVQFIVENDCLKIRSEKDTMVEFERLCLQGSHTQKETEQLIKKIEEKQKKEILNVP